MSGRREARIVSVKEFDPGVPSIARVYDYFLGGKDNFAADRELGHQLIGFVPVHSGAAASTWTSLPACLPA
jgi:hypothetical protein